MIFYGEISLYVPLAMSPCLFSPQPDVESKVSIFVYRLHRDWCDILSRSTIDVVLS